MFGRVFTGAVAALGMGFGLAVAPVVQADTLNVLIMAEDWDTDAVGRDSRIDRHIQARLDEVANKVTDRLEDEYANFDGIRIYDETAITRDTFTQDQVRRTDQDLIAIAKSIPSPEVDLVVLYTVYAYQRDIANGAGAALDVELFMRALDVRSGRSVGRVSEILDSSEGPMPLACREKSDAGRNCIIRQAAKELRNATGDGMTTLLRRAIRDLYEEAGASNVDTMMASGDCGSTANYSIEMLDFDRDELRRFEEEMTSWKCHTSYDVERRTETRTVYALEAKTNDATIQRDIMGAMDAMGLEARVRTDSTNGFVVIFEDR